MATAVQDDERLKKAKAILASNKPQPQPVDVMGPETSTYRPVDYDVNAMTNDIPQPQPVQRAASAATLPGRLTDAPPVQNAGSLGDNPYIRAQQLEDQAKPPAGPQGLGRQLLGAAAQGFQAWGHPGGYAGLQADQNAQEQQREKTLLDLAKQYRGVGEKRDQLNVESQRYQAESDWRERQANIQQQRYEDQAKHQRVLELLAAQKPEIVPHGAAVGTKDASGNTTYTIPSPETPTPKNQGFRDRFDPRIGHTFRDYFNQDNPAAVTSSADLGPPKPPESKGPMDPTKLASITQAIKNGDIVRENLSSIVGKEDEPQLFAELQRQHIPLLTKDQQTNARTLDSLSQSVDAIEELSKKVHVYDNGPEARAAGMAGRVEASLGMNDNVRQLQAEGLRAIPLVRALGERGRIPTQQVALAEQMLAMNPGLTRSEAQLSIKRLRDMISQARGTAMESVGSNSGAPTKTINGVLYEKVEGGWRKKKQQ